MINTSEWSQMFKKIDKDKQKVKAKTYFCGLIFFLKIEKKTNKKHNNMYIYGFFENSKSVVAQFAPLAKLAQLGQMAQLAYFDQIF